MKKIIPIGLLCIVLSTLFTSCGNELTITKRHYTKGYYVDHITKAHQAKVADKKTQPIVNLPSQQRTKVLVNNAVPYATKLKTANSVIIVKDKKSRSKLTPQQTTIQVVKDEPIVSNEAVITQTRETAHVSYYHDNDKGYSLLWLVVVVILILWLLGMLVGGFGGLLNILLLIALILLILWLLRIA